MKTSIPSRNYVHSSLPLYALLCVSFAIACFALLPKAQAVSPAPDGNYPGGNTAEGANALLNLTTGINNTAVGSQALLQNASGSYNVGLGPYALARNTSGSFNMAIGTDALYNNNADSNTGIGFRALYSNAGGNNLTAVGAQALYSNVDGVLDTAVGAGALHDNTAGNFNTAVGALALNHDTTGEFNTAVGYGALFSTTAGSLDSNRHNTAIGFEALYNNDGGAFNTAVGDRALFSYTHGNSLLPGYNTAVGEGALGNATGDYNTALGWNAGSNVTTANSVIAIGTSGADVSGSCYIGNIAGADATGGDPVFVTSDGKLGTVNPPSSARFKEEIKPMNQVSEAILALKPVTFRYKREFDPKAIPQFGLVAEEVEKVNPDLVKRGRDGKLQTVRYDAVNAMLLNEFLKENRKVQQLEANASRQQKEIEALTAGLEKVSAQLELSKPSQQTVVNKQ
jgi:hypothetical protein